MDIFQDDSKEHFLLVADYFSNFPIVRHLRSLHSTTVVSILRTLFSEQGTPEVIFTDQGTQFACEEFYKFAAEYGFEVQHSSPRHPQANGFAEAMV